MPLSFASPSPAAPARVAMVGAGYVGLVSAACLAESGCRVVTIDRSEERIGTLLSGRMPIYEPGLDALVGRNVAAGRLSFTTDLAVGVQGVDVAMIAVGTPPRPLDGHAELRHVFEAARAIGESLRGHAVVVTKSTVPAGTGREVARIVADANPRLDFDIASNPEFLREGSAVQDFMQPDRIVVGTASARARSSMERLYAPFASRGTRMIWTDVVSAELVKYAANTFLATKVSFINEMADLCEKVGGNIEDIACGMGTDRRIGPAFLQPGPGYGGSCFPKDTRAMVHLGEQALSPTSIVEAVIVANRARTHRMVSKIVDAAGGSVRAKRIALLGLAFKANTDDVRDSVAVLIAERLASLGAKVVAHDPKAMGQARAAIGDEIAYSESAEAALRGAELCVLATEWDEFAALRPEDFLARMSRPAVVDLRNLFDPQAMALAGIRYVSIGRPILPALVQRLPGAA